MDHGNPTIADGAAVWFCSDEHVTFTPAAARSATGSAGPRARRPDASPTTSGSTLFYGDEVVERWPVDLRGW